MACIAQFLESQVLQRSKLFVVAMLASIVSVESAQAQVVTYTDENLWRLAAGTYSLETFDGFTAGTQISTLSNLGLSLDVLDGSGAYPAAYDNYCGGSPRSGVNTLINFGYPCSFTPKGDLVFRPLAGLSIYSLGYWNTGGDDATQLQFFDVNDQLLGSTQITAYGFIGIVSTVAAYRGRISEVGGNTIFGIDDLQVGTASASAVPEPSTYALMAAGLAVLGFAARRRRRSLLPV